jgi:hypothetical protein
MLSYLTYSKKVVLTIVFSLLLLGCSSSDSSDTKEADSEQPIEETDSDKLPVVVLEDDQTIAEGENFKLDIESESEPDGFIISYKWTQVDNGAAPVQILNANTRLANFTSGDVSEPTEYIFKLTVTDNEQRTASDTITVTVTPIEHPQSAWQTSSVIDNSSLDVENPRILVDEQGMSHIIWLERDASIFNLLTRTYDTSTDTLGPIYRLNNESDDVERNYWNYLYKRFPETAMTILDDGTVFVAYIDNDEHDINIVYRNSETGLWTDPVKTNLSTDEDVSLPALITNGSALYLGWYQEEVPQTTFGLWAAEYDATSKMFNEPASVGQADRSVNLTAGMEGTLNGVVDASGNVTIAWSGKYGTSVTEDILISTKADSSDSWATPVVVDELDGIAGDPVIALSETNKISLAWVQDDGEFYAIYYSTKTVGSDVWQEPLKINETIARSLTPTIAVFNDQVFIAWVKNEGTVSSYDHLYINEFNGSAWVGEHEFTDLDATRPLIDIDGNGNAFLIFYQRHVYEARKTAGGEWTRPIHLQQLNGGLEQMLDINSSGNGAAVWIHRNSVADDLVISVYR